MAKTKWKKGSPVDQAVRDKLNSLIKKHTLENLSVQLGVHEDTLMRAATGRGLRELTRWAIEEKLRQRGFLENRAA